MDNQDPNKLYQEYADDEAERNGDLYGTERFRQILTASPVFQRKDTLANYEQRLQERALKELRTAKEWHDLEAEDIRHGTFGAMRHRSAEELLDYHNNKIQQCYKAITWHKNKITECDNKITELNTWTTDCKAKENRLNHWRKCRIHFDIAVQKHTDLAHRHERLINKWRSILHQLHEAYIAKEISAEKCGVGNRYGFNPNMQSRDTATGIFTED